MDEVSDEPELVSLAVEIVRAFVANNPVRGDHLGKLVEDAYEALAGRGPESFYRRSGERFPPAVTVRRSLASRDHILSMIDGKPYKLLTRHLASHGLTPAQYRAR